MLRLKALFLLLILLSVSVAESQASGQTTRRSGVVQAVDQTKHTFTLLPDGESKPVVIEWRQKSRFFGGFKTEFFADQDPASEAILKKEGRHPGAGPLPRSLVRGQRCNPRSVAQVAARHPSMKTSVSQIANMDCPTNAATRRGSVVM